MLCFSEDFRRAKFVALAWRRELKSCYDNRRNTGARLPSSSGVSLFLDRELKLLARNLQHVISYLLLPFVLITDSAELKLCLRHASLITFCLPISLHLLVLEKKSKHETSICCIFHLVFKNLKIIFENTVEHY